MKAKVSILGDPTMTVGKVYLCDTDLYLFGGLTDINHTLVLVNLENGSTLEFKNLDELKRFFTSIIEMEPEALEFKAKQVVKVGGIYGSAR
jgi:hypothetical protein